MNKKTRRTISIIIITIICIFSIFFTPKKNTMCYVDSSRDIVFQVDKELVFSPVWEQPSSAGDFLEFSSTYDYVTSIDGTRVDLPTYFTIVLPLLLIAGYFMITSIKQE